MAHVAFDTLKFVEKLKAAGVPEQQAKAISEAQNDAFNEAIDVKIATKQDINGLHLDLTNTRNDIRHEVEAVKSDVRLLKWMMGFLLAGMASLILRTFL